MSTERLGYKDFEGFARWYSNHRRRTTGREASPATLRTKMVWAAAAANILGCREEVFLGYTMSNRQSVEDVVSRLEARLTPGSLRQAVYALSDFGAYAVAQGWVERHEVRPQDIPSKNPTPAITIYTEAEMERFVEASRGYDLRWWALVCFLADTGRRIGETLSLRWDWFKLEDDPAYVELPSTKNGEPQYVPLTKRLSCDVFGEENVARLKSKRGTRAGKWGTPEWGFQRDPAVFPFPMGYRTARERMARFCERTGLPNRGFHNFRHTVITNRLASGMPIQAVAALAGHKSVSTTDQRYNHTNALSYAHLING